MEKGYTPGWPLLIAAPVENKKFSRPRLATLTAALSV